MNRIAELFVQSQTESIRKTCSQLFLQFLMYYPMAATRLQQHLDFLVKNLEYPYVEGRQSVLETINSVFNRLPKEVINDNVELFFFPLVTNEHFDEPK